jgi:hypothetical protein
LNKKFEDISKKTLNTFFKEKCFKIQKRYWMVNNDTLSQFNIKDEELEKIKKENFNIYKEKEEKRKKRTRRNKNQRWDNSTPTQSHRRNKRRK